MKIIYGISGEGQGHAVRSKPIIKHLTKDHNVKVICGGKAFNYLSQHFPTEKIGYFGIHYYDNSVSNIGTLFLNLRKSPKLFKTFFKTWKIFNEFKPHLVISDFEPFSAYFSYFFGIPLISIDNIHISSNSELEFSNKYVNDFLRVKAVTKSIIPRADIYLITTFFYPKRIKKNTHLFPPILREKIRNLKPKKGNHILVYQTSESYIKLFPELKKIDEDFIIYGFDKEKKDRNLIFKKRNEKEFFEDLANCKAVITNGGFTLMSEALYLKKPILSVPVRRQFEQTINATYLEKLGYGKFYERLNKKRIEHFLKNLDKYEENLKEYNKEDNKKLFRKLDSLIKKFK